MFIKKLFYININNILLSNTNNLFVNKNALITNGFFKNTNIFKKTLLIKGKKNFNFLKLSFKNIVKFLNDNLKFNYFRVVLFAGLGYKKKLYKKKNIVFVYIADRHWILYKLPLYSSIFTIKKRNFIFISKSKNIFCQDYNFFSGLKKPYIYKMKGFLDIRIKQRFLFVRRIKLKGIKTKLSKKQLLL